MFAIGFTKSSGDIVLRFIEGREPTTTEIAVFHDDYHHDLAALGFSLEVFHMSKVADVVERSKSDRYKIVHT